MGKMTQGEGQGLVERDGDHASDVRGDLLLLRREAPQGGTRRIGMGFTSAVPGVGGSRA